PDTLQLGARRAVPRGGVSLKKPGLDGAGPPPDFPMKVREYSSRRHWGMMLRSSDTPPRRRCQSAWRRKRGWQVDRLHLEQLLRLRQAVKLVQTKILEVDARRLRAGNGVPNRARQQ